MKVRIIHRDIKLENILINKILDKCDYSVLIADFGFAAFTTEEHTLSHKCGSPGYVAPEIFLKLPYSYKVDIFSLGTVFYNLVSGERLFNGMNNDELL
jgi:serine/threonine protein kinase